MLQDSFLAHTPLARPIQTCYIPAIVGEGFTEGCKPFAGRVGCDDNDDYPRGDDDVDDVQPRPPHLTINLSDEEKGGLSDEERGGGSYCGRESSRAGRCHCRRGEDPDDRDGEGEGEGDEVDGRRPRWRGSEDDDDEGGGGGDGCHRRCGHWSRDDRDDGDDGDGDDDDPTERL